MSGRLYTCTTCGWQVPADRFGAAIMQAHLEEKHDVPRSLFAEPDIEPSEHPGQPGWWHDDNVQ